MNIFLIGADKDKSGELADEITYSNITAIISSVIAFIISLVLLQGYGWIISVYIALGTVFLYSVPILFNYLGFSIGGRLLLSLIPPVMILMGNIITLIYIPNGTHAYSFDVRVLILASAALPLLLFRMEERAYFIIALIVNLTILTFFDDFHDLFNINYRSYFGEQYYISTYFYLIAFSLIVTPLLIFKIRLFKLDKNRKELFESLENKVSARTSELKKHSEELIRSNNELEQFSYSVSHHLRAPVARLLGLTGLFSKLDPNEQTSLVEKVSFEVVSLDSIISDLNEILQIRNNLYKIKEIINIKEEVKITQKVLVDSGQKMSFVENMELEIEKNTFWGVRAFLQSILSHLIGNAFKFKKERIDLKVKVITKKEGNNFILKIIDNGKGIDLSQHNNKLFKMYSRFHFGMQGKGLGLYLVKKQVEEMNGTIQVKSKVNQGTTFIITLPLPKPEQFDHQVYIENDVVKIIYNGILSTSRIFWKRPPTTEEFRDIMSNNIGTIKEYPTKYWINDTTNFGGLSNEDQLWFNEYAFPLLAKTGILGIIVINKEGRGFKNNQWNLMKRFCANAGIVLAFKHSLKEAKEFITSKRIVS